MVPFICLCIVSSTADVAIIIAIAMSVGSCIVPLELDEKTLDVRFNPPQNPDALAIFATTPAPDANLKLPAILTS